MRKIYPFILLVLFIFTYCSKDETPPKCDFEFESYDLNAPCGVNFTNLSTNFEDSFWDFGDSSTSIEDNPSHLYKYAGTYTATLTVKNSGGENETKKTIKVIQPTAYYVKNKSSFVFSSVMSFYNSEQNMYEMHELGKINPNCISNTYRTSRNNISVIFRFQNEWCLVESPYNIYPNKLNELTIDDYTSFYVVEIYSTKNLVTDYIITSKIIKIRDLQQ
ncbi:MAG: PKD domain-containing protein [Bacteroidales bacterium]|nr:PKD domain-containing protein [Bacteroidales bacterium]